MLIQTLASDIDKAVPRTRVHAVRAMMGSAYSFVRRWPILPLATLATLVIVGIFAPWIAPDDPGRTSLTLRNQPPFWMDGGSFERILGADHVGRDVLSRTIYGARISLIIVAVSLSTGFIVGTALGVSAGYSGGWIDELVMRLVDLWFAIPFLLLALIVVVIFSPSLIVVLVLLALLTWAAFVRNIRAEVLVLKKLEYIDAARISGASAWRIGLRHLLPGVVNTALVIATLRVGGLILAEASLSFLGAGIPPPTPAWGVIIADGRSYLDTAWWVSTVPGLALFGVVMSMNFLGDWMRDRFDPKLRQIR